MKGIIFGSVMLTAIGIGIVFGIVMTAPFEETVTTLRPEKRGEWVNYAGPSPATFAVGSTNGIVYIAIVDHTAGNNGTLYMDNITDIKDSYVYMYENAQYNCTLSGNCPSGTTIDFVITVRCVDDDLYNGTTPQVAAGSAVSASDWIRMNATCLHTTPNIIADTPADGRRNVTDAGPGNPGGIDGFYNFFWNNSGSGYVINPSQWGNFSFTYEVYQ